MIEPDEDARLVAALGAHDGRRWLGDGRLPEGEDEWPALLRSLDD